MLWVTGDEHLFNDLLHEAKVIAVEFHCVFFPELLSVDWAPFQEFSLDLVLPLLERTKFLVVLVKVGPQTLKKGGNFLVHPVSVLELDD